MPTAYAFPGLRGTGDFVDGQRPKNWRETILRLFPAGDASVTALSSLMKNEATNDPEFNWFTKVLPQQKATIVGIFTDAAGTAAYVSGAALGATLYVAVEDSASNGSREFRIGHQVVFRNDDDSRLDCNGKVIGITDNGANLLIAVKLLEADDNAPAAAPVTAKTLADADEIVINGNINSEGGLIPDVVSYDPVKLYNYTQIFRTPLEITRTAKKTKLRTGEAYAEAKMEALELHGIEMEKAFLWGIRTETVGSNGKPERTTMGLAQFIRTYAPTNVSDFRQTAAYAGDSWATSGKIWLDSMLEILFRYGGDKRLCLCGSGALLGIQKLAEENSQIFLEPNAKLFGLAVVRLITPFGEILLKRHPLFSHDATSRNAMMILEPKNMKFRPLDDTEFKNDPGLKQAGQLARDGIKEEYITEAGFELHHAETFMYLNGVGQANGLTP